MTVINTNIKSLYTQAALKLSERDSKVAMQQLATGKRINSAKDDAAGLSIAARMTQQIKGLNQASRNAGDAISFVQTVDGATSEITNMLQRMSELAVQASNATYSDEQRGFLDLEFQQLKQEIVRISDTHEWNGFKIMNGSAGAPVGPAPVYKVTSQADLNPGVNYTAGSVSSTNGGTFTSTGSLAKSGIVSIAVDGSNAVTANLTLDDGSNVSLTGTLSNSNKTVTFSNTALTNGAGTFTLVSTAALTSSSTSFTVGRSFTQADPILADDIRINGQSIAAPSALDDTLSSTGNAASAIAKAAAINKVSADTRVTAVVNKNVMSGSAMTAGQVSGTVTINGYTTGVISTTSTSTADSRAATIKAINAISGMTGVVAVDSKFDTMGIRLEAADGRNIAVAFNTAASSTSFAAATGLQQGLQMGTVSLANVADKSIDITSVVAGGSARIGLLTGSYNSNISSVTTMTRPLAQTTAPNSLGVEDLSINGTTIRATTAADDNISNTTSTTSSTSASAIAIAAAINDAEATTGVHAVANGPTTSGYVTTIGTETGSKSLFVNGINVQITMSTTDSAAQRRTNVITAINATSGLHGTVATDNGAGGVTLKTSDGRNLSVWFDSGTVNAAAFGLATTGTTPTSGVTGIASATISSNTADTLYGTVTLQSKNPITLKPAANGYGSSGDFSKLGFQEGTVGGVIDPKSGNLPRQTVGRMSFQVGPAANQLITIDLQDFGKNGTVTGDVTGDVDSAAPKVNIKSVADANAVIDKIAKAMDNVNAQRSTMGAVMNRLEHVIDNLNTVSMNAEASRSQIEDADYAKASTELARTQIMQQAATAVLAQANTSQQTVLKLLQQ